MGDFNVQVVYVLIEEDNASLLKADAEIMIEIEDIFLRSLLVASSYFLEHSSSQS
jgi:hypothetical protein